MIVATISLKISGLFARDGGKCEIVKWGKIQLIEKVRRRLMIDLWGKRVEFHSPFPDFQSG